MSGDKLTLGESGMRKEGAEEKCNVANKITIASLHLNMSECKTGPLEVFEIVKCDTVPAGGTHFQAVE